MKMHKALSVSPYMGLRRTHIGSVASFGVDMEFLFTFRLKTVSTWSMKEDYSPNRLFFCSGRMEIPLSCSKSSAQHILHNLYDTIPVHCVRTEYDSFESISASFSTYKCKSQYHHYYITKRHQMHYSIHHTLFQPHPSPISSPLPGTPTPQAQPSPTPQ